MCCGGSTNTSPPPPSLSYPRRASWSRDLGGNRPFNSVPHIVHVTQARIHEPAKTFLAKSTATGKTARGARRAHKRHLANVIIRRMWTDAKRAHSAPSTVAA